MPNQIEPLYGNKWALNGAWGGYGALNLESFRIGIAGAYEAGKVRITVLPINRIFATLDCRFMQIIVPCIGMKIGERGDYGLELHMLELHMDPKIRVEILFRSKQQAQQPTILPVLLFVSNM